MKKSLLSSLLFLSLLLTNCGARHKAQNVVDEFLKQHLVSDSYDLESLTDLDSTFYVTDSMVQLMHQRAAANPMFKPSVSYQPRTPKLLFMHVKVSQNGQSYKQTFYFDSTLTVVVSFKND